MSNNQPTGEMKMQPIDNSHSSPEVLLSRQPDDGPSPNTRRTGTLHSHPHTSPTAPLPLSLYNHVFF